MAMIEPTPAPTKPAWTSKTLWINAIAFVAAAAGAFGIDLGLDAETQTALVGGIMAAVNIVLRLVTVSGVRFRGTTTQAAWPATIFVILLTFLLMACTTSAPPDAKAALDEQGNVVVVDQGQQVSIDVTADQGMAIFCRSYSGTVGALAAFRSKMTAEQVQAVDDSIAVAEPLCRAAAAGETADLQTSLTRVRDELRAMLMLEQEFKT